MKTLTVAMKDVRIGDRVYNSNAYHPSAAWVRVVGVRIDGHRTVVVNTVYEQHGHSESAIAVQREEGPQ